MVRNIEKEIREHNRKVIDLHYTKDELIDEYLDLFDTYCDIYKVKKYILNKMYLEDNKDIIETYQDILRFLYDYE